MRLTLHKLAVSLTLIFALMAFSAVPAQASHKCFGGLIIAANVVSCSFAGNVGNAYQQNRVQGGYAWVRSPVTRKWYHIRYHTVGAFPYGTVHAFGPNGIWVWFGQAG